MLAEQLIRIPAELAKEANGKGFIEVVIRDAKKRFEKFLKLPIEELEKEKNAFQPDQLGMLFKNNAAALGKLNVAFGALNMVATIASTVIICQELDKIKGQIDDLKSSVEKLAEMNFEIQIARPCRDMLAEYKLLSNKLEKNKPISEGDLVQLIRGLNNYLITLYNLKDKCDLDAVLNLIFSLLPVYSNCIMIYYEHFYNSDEKRHPLHEDWMSVFDRLSNYAFVDQIQDHMFIDQRQTNAQVNEYLKCQRLIVSGFRGKIEQLLADLEACDGVEGYNEAIRWSRQYAQQQAKTIQADLEARYGFEAAREMMAPVIREACA